MNSSAQHCKRGLYVLLNNCNKTFSFLKEFGVIICKQHCTAVVSLNAHLRKYHAASATLRRQILERFSQYKTVAPNAIKLLDEPVQPIEELGSPLDSAQCEICSWITINKDKMRRHCKKNHYQAQVEEKSLLYKTIKVQSFFRTSGLQKYIIVDLVDAENSKSAEVETRVQAQLAEYKLTQQEIKEELQTLEAAAKINKTGWFKRTGWLEFFKDRILAYLAHQARAPDYSERKIKLAAQLTEGLRTGIVTLYALDKQQQINIKTTHSFIGRFNAVPVVGSSRQEQRLQKKSRALKPCPRFDAIRPVA